MGSGGAIVVRRKEAAERGNTELMNERSPLHSSLFTSDMAVSKDRHASSMCHAFAIPRPRRRAAALLLRGITVLLALLFVLHHLIQQARHMGQVETDDQTTGRPDAERSFAAADNVTNALQPVPLGEPLQSNANGLPRQMVDGQVCIVVMNGHHRQSLDAQLAIHPPQLVVQMNVLALLPETASPLPNFSSYYWILVREADLRTMSPEGLRRHLHQLFVVHKPVFVVSFGEESMWIKRGVGGMPFNFRRLWVHFPKGESLTQDALTACFLESENPGGHPDHPLISVVTPTYRSGPKLQRAYQSLLNQTYDYWEWIIWDDSPEQDTFAMLTAMALDDMRIHVFKAPQRSGLIGEMKFRAGSLASGQWLVELDHDDRIAPRLFEWIRDIASKHPATKFIYSDHSELLEEGDGPFSYGQNYGYNYGSYARQHVRSHDDGPLKPHYISRSAWPNRHTLHHLVGLPNHVRVWNKAFYDSIGRHRPFLSVADDYDLIVRSFLAANPGEWVCIAAPAYFQYRNIGGDNFTFKRNALIQHLVGQLHQWYYPQLLAKYGVLGWEEPSGWPRMGIWETDLVDVEPRMERYFVPEDQDPNFPCISIILPTHQGGAALQDAIQAIVAQTYHNWKLFIIGDGCPELDAMAEREFPSLYPDHLGRLLWYNLRDYHDDGFVVARNYALRMIVKTEWVAYAQQDGPWQPNQLKTVVDACIRPLNGSHHSLCMDGGSVQGSKPSALIMHRLDLTDRHGFWKKAAEGSAVTPERDFLDRLANESWMVIP